MLACSSPRRLQCKQRGRLAFHSSSTQFAANAAGHLRGFPPGSSTRRTSPKAKKFSLGGRPASQAGALKARQARDAFRYEGSFQPAPAGETICMVLFP